MKHLFVTGASVRYRIRQETIPRITTPFILTPPIQPSHAKPSHEAANSSTPRIPQWREDLDMLSMGSIGVYHDGEFQAPGTLLSGLGRVLSNSLSDLWEVALDIKLARNRFHGLRSHQISCIKIKTPYTKSYPEKPQIKNPPIAKQTIGKSHISPLPSPIRRTYLLPIYLTFPEYPIRTWNLCWDVVGWDQSSNEVSLLDENDALKRKNKSTITGIISLPSTASWIWNMCGNKSRLCDDFMKYTPQDIIPSTNNNSLPSTDTGYRMDALYWQSNCPSIHNCSVRQQTTLTTFHVWDDTQITTVVSTSSHPRNIFYSSGPDDSALINIKMRWIRNYNLDWFLAK